MPDLFKHAMDTARKSVNELTEPDDDIMPVLLYVGPHGLGLMPLLNMKDDQAKDQLAAAMLAALLVGVATEAAMVTTSWVVEMEPKDGKYHGPMPSQHPDRREAVMVMHVAGEDDFSMGQAILTRWSDRPPYLGEWKTWTEDDMKIGGRFGDAIYNGLAMVRIAPKELVEIIEAAWEDGTQEDLMHRFLKVHKQMTGIGLPMTIRAVEVDPT